MAQVAQVDDQLVLDVRYGVVVGTAQRAVMFMAAMFTVTAMTAMFAMRTMFTVMFMSRFALRNHAGAQVFPSAVAVRFA